MERPEFNKLQSFEEFNQYYWYKEELVHILKDLNLKYTGTKQDLYEVISEHFKGNDIKQVKSSKIKKKEEVSLHASVLRCGFSFNEKFRNYFSSLTGIKDFKFNADMATTIRKVKKEKDYSFTIENLLQVYYGTLDYASYDHSLCWWNQFLKDFCQDERSHIYTNKLKVAAILWQEVKDSTSKKVYRSELLDIHQEKINDYLKDKF